MASIRTFQAGDESAVVALWQRCGLTRPWNDPLRDIQRKLDAQPDLFAVLCANGSGEVIGTVMAGYEGHRGWINYLAVSPDAQRGGHGRALMAWAEARLRECGCPKINLQVRRGNEPVLAFYAAIGFGEDDVVSLGKRLVNDG
ncbi:MAG: GNAT family acetyltransferase [Vitreoscilla sp.]|nr:GNAT family acetyltransferase [Vitreoscilla sp.]